MNLTIKQCLLNSLVKFAHGSSQSPIVEYKVTVTRGNDWPCQINLICFGEPYTPRHANDTKRTMLFLKYVIFHSSVKLFYVIYVSTYSHFEEYFYFNIVALFNTVIKSFYSFTILIYFQFYYRRISFLFYKIHSITAMFDSIDIV